jgi:hypothetical protein
LKADPIFQTSTGNAFRESMLRRQSVVKKSGYEWKRETNQTIPPSGQNQSPGRVSDAPDGPKENIDQALGTQNPGANTSVPEAMGQVTH